MKVVIVVSVLLGFMSGNLNNCEGYRILGVFPLESRSHFMMHEALMKGLARKGHQVDVVSAFPQRTPYPNYTDIVVLPTSQLVNNLTYNHVETWSQAMLHDTTTKFGNDLCKALELPKMLELIRNPPKNPPYDLVITEVLSAHCFIGLGYHFKVPTIGVCTALFYSWQNGITANPSNLAFVPNNLIDYAVPMSFFQRLHNTLVTAYEIMYIQYYTRPQDEIIRKYFGRDAPGVRELERSLDLVLVNSHSSLNGAKPFTPAVIEVGGLHVQDDGPELPQDIRDWMDDSTAGFVYFTFGSMVKIESFPKETILALYKSLGKISPIRVLMKIPEPELLPPGMPDNFRTFKWISQFKVLKHKNIKAFITHGGLMGTQEAVYCGVPMIGIPLFADQYTNINQYVAKKIAVKLNWDNITEENMDEALNEILYNPIYKNTIKDISAKFADRPMSPIDTATWWVEYVIRHGGAALRSPAMDLAWWQIELLDVYAFILLVTLILIYTIVVLVKYLIKKYARIKFPVTFAKKED